MPCTDLFDSQSDEYRQQVLPSEIAARVVIEAGVTENWWRYAGERGQVIGIDQFGKSAPAPELFEHFGFSTDNVVAKAKEVLAEN
jgi:transketolase